MFSRQPDLAIEQCRKTLEVWPNSGGAHIYLDWAYGMKGLYEQAIASWSDPKLAARAKRAYGRFGARGYNQIGLNFLLERKKHIHVDPVFIAQGYTSLGQRDEAFAWLEKAYEERSFYLAEHLSCGPWFDSLRSDPRFQDLLRRMNLPP